VREQRLGKERRGGSLDSEVKPGMLTLLEIRWPF
jgi:hypothetical protein